MQKVTLYGPAHDMSLSSGGYYVNCDGHWMRTTVVVVPRFSQHVCGNTPELELPPPEAPELEYAPTTPGDEEIPVDLVLTGDGVELREDVAIQELPEGPQRLSHRLHGKQTVPALPARLTHRLTGKQTDPRALAVLRIGGECYGKMMQFENLQDGRGLRDGDLQAGRGLRDGDLQAGRGLRDGDLRAERGLRDGNLQAGRGLRDGGSTFWTRSS